MLGYVITTLVFLILLTVFIALAPGQVHKWKRCLVSDSHGPQHHLILEPSNVTQWVQEHTSARSSISTDWFLRIDDGALYPRTLLTEEELAYQQWIWDRYPEVNTIRTSGKYLQPEFLQHVEDTMLVDKYYHISHCVVTLRRYWIARETGTHICPVDLHSGHIQHCFQNILEPWAFPRGLRGEVMEDDAVAPMFNISWRGRVCF